MKPVLPAVFMMALAVAPALAAPARERLEGFNSVAFGATFEAAKAQLGPNAKDNTEQGDADKSLVVSGMQLFGEKAGINYTFSDKGKLAEVYAIFAMPTGDFAVCQARWSAIRSRILTLYGAADSDTTKMAAQTPMETMVFKFKDGSHLDADLTGCLMQLSYLAAGH